MGGRWIGRCSWRPGGSRTAGGLALAALPALGLVALIDSTPLASQHLSAGSMAAATTRPLPFVPGEELLYRVRSARFGDVGTGIMRVDGAEELRGRSVYRLHFGVRAKIALAGVTDSTCSWLDPVSMTSLRYHKDKRALLGSQYESVDLFGAERRWESRDGDEAGPMPTSAPLDELSFLYFIRTLPLEDGDSYVIERHFDVDRNPVRVQVLSRERVTVPAGEYDAIVLEMRVRDLGNFGGDGLLRLHLTDDDRRMPVRIESSMPLVGTVALELTAASDSAPLAGRFPTTP